MNINETPLGKYMVAVAMTRPEGRKTDVWEIRNARHGDKLGSIAWYGAWRQYVFEVCEFVVLSHDCMAAIQRFLVAQNQARKA